MNPDKRTEMLNGSLVRPIRIGRKAILVHNGKLLLKKLFQIRPTGLVLAYPQ